MTSELYFKKLNKKNNQMKGFEERITINERDNAPYNINYKMIDFIKNIK